MTAVHREMTTYRRADGEPVGDYSWVTELDWFDDDDERTELIVEHWHRVSTDTIIVGPAPTCVECGEEVDADGALCPECAVEATS